MHHAPALEIDAAALHGSRVVGNRAVDQSDRRAGKRDRTAAQSGVSIQDELFEDRSTIFNFHRTAEITGTIAHKSRTPDRRR